MAFSIGHEYDLNKITRNSFELEAEHIGLGKKIAMTRFDNMAFQFKEAMNNAMNDMAVDFSTVDELGGKKRRYQKLFIAVRSVPQLRSAIIPICFNI